MTWRHDLKRKTIKSADELPKDFGKMPDLDQHQVKIGGGRIDVYRAWIVLERTEGCTCWTIAFKNPEVIQGHKAVVPCNFHKRELAEAWVREVHSKRRGWWGGKPNQRPMQSCIVEVELPE